MAKSWERGKRRVGSARVIEYTRKRPTESSKKPSEGLTEVEEKFCLEKPVCVMCVCVICI